MMERMFKCEAFPSLTDESGQRKPFEQFLQEVRTIDDRYNKNYLRAEYNFATASAQMAAKWEQFEADGDRYNLQYRTAGDDKVRPAHAELNGVTLPPSDPFWDVFYPPNGFNCRCTVVQVRKSSYPATDSAEAMERGDAALEGGKGMFRFNPGKEKSIWPKYNPYTIRRCSDCDRAKGKMAKPMEGDMCDACVFLRTCINADYTPDAKFGARLQAHKRADIRELEDNLRAGRAILSSFDDVTIKVRQHVLSHGVSNPEYEFNEEMIGDRKGIESCNGVKDAFGKAKKQGCSIVVLDLDMHPKYFKTMPSKKLAKALNNRVADFRDGSICQCYVIFNKRAVRIDKIQYESENKAKRAEAINAILETIQGRRSDPE